LTVRAGYIAKMLTTRTGSLADIPEPLLKKIKELEAEFTIPTEKLKQITAHFVNELKQGLTAEGGDIVQPSF
jgi:hexokinase